MAGNDDSAAARASRVVHTSHAASLLFHSISPDYLNGQEAATPEAAEATTTKLQREKKIHPDVTHVTIKCPCKTQQQN